MFFLCEVYSSVLGSEYLFFVCYSTLYIQCCFYRFCHRLAKVINKISFFRILDYQADVVSHLNNNINRWFIPWK